MGTYAQGAQTAGSGAQAGRDVGFALYSKTVAMQAAVAANVDVTTYLPDGAQIVDIIMDTLTAHTSASAAISIGTSAAGGTELASATTVTTGVRVRPTFTAAQLTVMNALVRNSAQLDEAIYVRLALGAVQTAVGLTNVTFVYSLKVN
jgi:hypothetical protein